MSPLPRPKPSPGVLVRALVSLGAVWAVAAALAAYVAGRAVPGPGFGAEFATLVVIGALARRYGVALPGNGFSSYILGVTAFAVLDRGWATPGSPRSRRWWWGRPSPQRPRPASTSVGAGCGPTSSP